MERRRRGCLAGAVLLLVGGLGVSCLGCTGSPLVLAGLIRGETALRERGDPKALAPGRFVDTDAGSMHVMAWGDDGPLVLFVHGSAAWSGVFEPLATELVGLRVVAMDLPPFGYSERVDADYSRPRQAERIWALVDALGAEEVVLVGHSFGAGPVMEAAMARPERVAGVALLSGALSLGAEPAALGPLAWDPLREVATAATLTQPIVYPAVLRSMVFDERVVTDAWVERYIRPLPVRGTTGAVSDWVPELLAPASAQSLDEAAYRDLEVPVLLVAGSSDEVTPVAQLRHVESLLPRARLVVLPDVGHLPPVEAPQAAAKHLQGFVDGL